MSGNVRPIVHYGDPVLHQRCTEVTEFDQELAELVDDMFASMYEADGVGLAANQIGVNARVFVIDCPDDEGKHTVAHIVNPELQAVEGERKLVLENEGCLSVPGEYTEVARADHAVVTGKDKNGKDITLEGTGFLARCLQHETDHLNGTVYVDKLPKKVRKRLLKNAGLSESNA
ncbi:peptide deformylase [Haloglycomyces albus]|uniref:peptide deformylase n=1 Tax=Haloglycomyces albus TaxID=526067 RepID=UPI00046CAE54|nr:peptide deformylase [Haloglycomyces albus]